MLPLLFALGVASADDGLVEARHLSWSSRPEASYPAEAAGQGFARCEAIADLDGAGRITGMTIGGCGEPFVRAAQAALAGWRAVVDAPLRVRIVVQFLEPFTGEVELEGMTADAADLSVESDYVPPSSWSGRDLLPGEDTGAGPVGAAALRGKYDGPVSTYVPPTVEWVRRTFPKYPKAALQAGLGDQRCVAQVTLDARGVVQDVEVAGCAPELVESTIATVSRWRAVLHLKGDVPRDQVRTAVVVRFTAPG